MAAEICDSNTEVRRQSRFLLLLVTLLGLMVLEPFLFDRTGIKFLLDIFFSVILFTSIYAVSEKKQTHEKLLAYKKTDIDRHCEFEYPLFNELKDALLPN